MATRVGQPPAAEQGAKVKPSVASPAEPADGLRTPAQPVVSFIRETTEQLRAGDNEVLVSNLH